MTSDESLMLQFQTGSRDSFEELFARYRQPIYAFFRRRLPSEAAAEDLAQETWVAVLKGSVRYEPRAPFRAYLYAIAFRLMLAERRNDARRNTTMLADATSPAGPGPEASHWIREALHKLDASEREIIMLREYEQFSYEEIAKLLSLPINTVRSRLWRARLAMRQLLEPQAEPVAAPGRF